MTPVFLELDDLLKIHEDQVARYGGGLGVRDMGGLESALAMPRAGFGGQYFHADLAEMAAAYLFHIVSNHPFVDGNKRTGTMAAYVFLGLNGLDLMAPQKPFETLILSVAKGESDKKRLAEFLRRHARPRA